MVLRPETWGIWAQRSLEPLWATLLTLVSATLAVPGVQQIMRTSDEGVVFTVNRPQPFRVG